MRQFPFPFLLLSLLLITPQAIAKIDVVEVIKKQAETQIRHLIEPVLEKYCHDDCKLMSVAATVDVAQQEDIEPGFDDIDAKHVSELTPSSARIKLLVNARTGPVSRGKLLELIQQYLDTLDYPVKVDVQSADFPQPIGSIAKALELRDSVARQFRNAMDEVFQQFCPDQCLLADFNLQTDTINGEEVQYGAPGEFYQDGGVAIRVKDISATILMDESLTPQDRMNILEIAKLKTNRFKNVTLTSKSTHFPQPMLSEAASRKLASKSFLGLGSSEQDKKTNESKTASETTTKSDNNSKQSKETNANTNTNSNNVTDKKQENEIKTEQSTKQEKFEKFEKIERVENGDAVQKELHKFKIYGLIFGCSVLSLLIFIAIASLKPRNGVGINKIIEKASRNKAQAESLGSSNGARADQNHADIARQRYEIDRIRDELMAVFAQSPKVAKQVFSRILTEEGVEITAQYIELFGESIVIDMLHDSSLQADVNELVEYYAKNIIDMKDDEKLDLLRKLHNRTVSGKLVVLGNRSSNLFDFLTEMDGMQILELIKNETLTVKSIVLTQCDPQKRASIYGQMDEDSKMKLLAELSRIDYLPRDFISNVASALKRKKRENPRLNTEALPGSDVLVNLLERTGTQLQKNVIRNLEMTSPESARNVKGKLVSVDTLRFLRDGQMLEVVLSLRHDELLQFLKGSPKEVRDTIFSKAPKELVSELTEELEHITLLSRDAYHVVERKVLNRMKMMANEGLINLVETNERMFASYKTGGTMTIETTRAGQGRTAP